MVRAVIFVALSFFVAGSVFAAGPLATKDECVSKVEEVAKIAKDKGPDAAIKAVMADKSPFVWKDSYVFIVDEDGVTVAHPANKALVGKSLMHLKDVDGKLFMQEFVNLGKTQGKGWVEYKWPKPEAKEPSKKASYVVKQGKLIIGAGVYPE